ncbi:MAG TPA: NAD(P)-dependent oxidoreductase [Candidatus Binatia bacterium]|jgi:3-hydroxyisobutyrate dehydrogenase-like beta-hydroxyacid dehydrogenase|nr:NAD(P)-dependent oxidoreductase [Candidatus Binatia bacterium]
MQTIGLIGLGNAGRPVAERILSKGYGLNVFDIDGAAVDAAVRRGANGANSAADAVGDMTVTLLPSSVEVRQVVFGESGVFKSLRPGMTLIDLSGTDPDCARELQQRLAEKQVTFVGGTIHASGAPAVVIPQGRFSIVVGGEKVKLGPAVGFLNDVADTIICLPEPWMPKAFKIAIILYATTNNIITAEICSWLTAQGSDPKLFLQLLRTTGAEASSARLEEFMKRNNNDGGALSNSYKDFRQALDMAAKLEIPMPLASMANQIQEMGRATGLQRFNSPAAMGKLYELITGTDLSQATFNAEKRFPESREPRVVYLGE